MIKIFRYFLDAGILYLGCFISSKDKFKNVFKRTTICLLINTLFQFISMITRKGDLKIIQEDFISLFILNLDYILLMLISHKVYFMEGGIELCGIVLIKN